MKILIIKLGARGDVLRTTSILPALKEKYPRSEILWLTGEKSYQILQGNPYLKEVAAFPGGEKELAAMDFDIVLNLDEDTGAARAASGLGGRKQGFYLQGDRILSTPSFEYMWRMGLHGPRPENDRLKKQNRLSYQRLLYDALQLGGEIHRPVLSLNREEVGGAKKLLGTAEGNYVGLNFSASAQWPAKRLPVSSAIELANLLAGRGLIPVVFGSGDEKKEIRMLRENLETAVFAANLPFKKFAAVVQECGIILTTDSLAFHVGAATGAYIVGLFGPTSAAEGEIYGAGKKYTAPKECRCCYRKKCKQTPRCMSLFDMEDILNTVERGKGKNQTGV